MNDTEQKYPIRPLEPEVRDISNFTNAVNENMKKLNTREKSLFIKECFSVEDVSDYLNGLNYEELDKIYKNVFFTGVYMSGDLSDYLTLITTTAILKKGAKKNNPDITIRDLYKKIFKKEYEEHPAVADMMDKNCIIMDNSLSMVEPKDSYGYTSSNDIIKDIYSIGSELMPY